MSLIDATINVIDIEALAPEVVDGEELENPKVEFAAILGHIVPMMTPQGPQGAVVPFGALRFSIGDREKIAALRDQLDAALEVIPDRSALRDFSIASNMSEVEAAAAAMKQAAGR